MASERLTFEGSTGAPLAARMDLPEGRPLRSCALFAHCFTCSKDLKAVVNIGRALNEAGIGVLRFDFTGLGESEGDFVDTGFVSNVDDLLAAARFLADEHRPPEILIGHSLGGAAVIQAAAGIESAVAVATIGAPADPRHVTHLLEGSAAEIRERGEAEVVLAGRRFRIGTRFLEDLTEVRQRQAIQGLRRALLIFHSPVDGVVGIENAASIFEAARHPKSFISLDRADHLLSNETDSRYVGAVLAAWANKYLEPAA
ncbi:MAG: alpha/beta hydrolase family protein [Gemmatimonadota bacterium]